jgi:predicted 3-demethylubiquinone-9 3-methyltransferase (glyoxalase superfamily)
MHNIMPCLCFNQEAEAAARYYVSLFPNSRIESISYYTEGMPMPAGTVLTVFVELLGQRLMLLNAGPSFKLSEAVSLMVPCATQAELDAYWDKLLDGGEAQQCGWLRDRYGLSWQLVPAQLEQWLAGDAAATQRVMQAVMGMVKLDIAAMEQAFRG